METNRIKQFMALVQTGHLRKAAEAMKMSHGAFHKAMGVLQGELGFPLYALDGRSIVITPQGQAFHQRAQVFLEAEKQLFRADEGAKAALRIGTHETFATYLLAPKWKKHGGSESFVCRDLLPGRLEEAVERGVVDVGLTYNHLPRIGLDAIHMGRVELGIYAAPALAKGRPFAELPFVAPVLPLETTPSAARGLDGWPDATVPRRVAFAVDLLSTALNLAGDGVAAAFVPHFVVKAFNASRAKEARLTLVDLPRGFGPVHRDVYMVQRVGAVETKSLRLLGRLVRAELHGRST